jgi:hypothetical protein
MKKKIRNSMEKFKVTKTTEVNDPLERLLTLEMALSSEEVMELIKFYTDVYKLNPKNDRDYIIYTPATIKICKYKD